MATGKESKKKKKLLSADEFYKIKDSKQEFHGPKSTKGSLGSYINKLRDDMDTKIKVKKIKPEKRFSQTTSKMKTGGRAGYQGGGRTNLFEELGRVEGEPSNRNRRAEVSRIHGELNRGYSKGGRTGLKHGGAAKRGRGCEIKS